MNKYDKYNNYSKNDLIDELESLKKKKYGLVWDRKNSQELIDAFVNWENVPENFTPNKFPVLKEVENKSIFIDKNKPVNLLIEGDNYHSLAVLNFTHKNKIDVIYIDPPYNTGNNDFIFNDKFVDKEDPWRHSKWLTFMEKRLRLAKSLLKKSGVIFISIDDNEVAQLKLLLDEIFEEKNFIALLPTIMNLKGNQDQFGFAGTHEYTLVYAKNLLQSKINEFDIDEEELEDWEEDSIGYFKKGANLKATGVNAPKEKRPNLFFPIFITKDGDFYVSENNKPINPEDLKLLPITDNKEMSWRWSKKKIMEEKTNLIIERTNSNNITFYKKQRPKIGDLPSKKPKSFFYKPKYSSGNGTAQLKDIFGEKVFNNPKPVDLIKDFIILGSPKDGIILDFTAGSGTTGQAVLKLNAEDEGHRKFILCTNNENNICTDVCYPRLERIIKGYINPKKQEIKGFITNLNYLITGFVGAQPTDKNKRELVNNSAEMICIKEDMFELLEEDDLNFKIYSKGDKYLGIIFNEEAIEDFKERADKLDGQFIIYCFSYTDTPPEKEFTDMKNKHRIEPIPEIILKVYREIFKK
jgi:adenine-specific DNA-methyltransferase